MKSVCDECLVSVEYVRVYNYKDKIVHCSRVKTVIQHLCFLTKQIINCETLYKMNSCYVCAFGSIDGYRWA